VSPSRPTPDSTGSTPDSTPARTRDPTPGSLPPMGAHVSKAGGLARALERGREIDATALQVFTGQPRRWSDPALEAAEVEAFREALAGSPVRVVAAHDSYLINLASDDPEQFRRSEAAFRAELARCVRLGIDFLVTHPGNATGGDREEALERNAAAVAAALEATPGPTVVLFETTAGSGTALGWRFEELAALLEAAPAAARERLGVCLDTAHVHAAGYDLRSDFGAVIDEFDSIVGLDRLRLFHLNDSLAERGSRVDRHEHLGEGELGEAPFRALMTDARLRGLPRVLETPKGDDPAASDRENLARLRRWAGAG